MCDDHREQYNNERVRRWGMAKYGEPRAAQRIAELIEEKIDDSVSINRYDVIWFSQYEPSVENEWVKGSADYYMTISLNNRNYTLYSEIKIKSQEYRKTIWGGRTARGSNISRYGCTSYYLDIIPVYRNMNDFCDKVGINKESFIVCFVSEDNNNVNIISLAEINDLINNGWNNMNICTYGEGYGQRCYLIPKDATHDLEQMDESDIMNYFSLRNVILPQE